MTTPTEPLAGSMISPAQFPGGGFRSGDPVDVDAVNAYAERVGWRCRFTLRRDGMPGLDIVYPPSERDNLPPALVAELDGND